MKLTTNNSTIRNSILIAVGLLVSTQAIAESQCKGLDNSSCDAKAFCGWVQGYERKDGIKVKSFCRTSSKGVAKKVQKN